MTFKQATAKAKKLYKTGKYKKFSDAVSAAFKGAAKKPARKRKTGATKKTVRRRRPAAAQVAHRRTSETMRSQAEGKLAAAFLKYERATTVKATKEAQQEMNKYRRVIRALNQ